LSSCHSSLGVSEIGRSRHTSVAGVRSGGWSGTRKRLSVHPDRSSAEKESVSSGLNFHLPIAFRLISSKRRSPATAELDSTIPAPEILNRTTFHAEADIRRGFPSSGAWTSSHDPRLRNVGSRATARAPRGDPQTAAAEIPSQADLTISAIPLANTPFT